MGAFLYIIDDNFNKEKEYGYIKDDILDPIIKISKEGDFNCLSCVLGYENTIFNSSQMEEIKKELNILISHFQDQNIKHNLKKIKEAIEFAEKDPPLYLLFEGD